VVYGYSTTDNSYIRTVMDFGSGYRLRDYDGGGRLEPVGGDYRFKYAFSCGACSFQPLTVWQYGDFSLGDVSPSFPGPLRRDARRLYRLYQRFRHGRDSFLVKGVLPAYLADMCRIGRCAAGSRTVDRARRRGELTRQGPGDFPPFGRAYVAALRRFLTRTGYIR
jgi:hypothetical protein